LQPDSPVTFHPDKGLHCLQNKLAARID